MTGWEWAYVIAMGAICLVVLACAVAVWRIGSSIGKRGKP